MNKYVIAYIGSIVLANLLVAAIGPWFSVVNSFMLIGLDLSLRDKLHESWDGNKLTQKMLALIASAGLISYALNPASGQIAIASVVAFTLSMVVDSAVFQRLKDRAWWFKSNTSNIAGAAIDSILFPTIAFGALMPSIVAMQFASKIAGGFAWSMVLRK